MIVNDIGWLIWHVFEVKCAAPYVDSVSIKSYESPYRRARTVVIKLPGTYRTKLTAKGLEYGYAHRALMIGWWRPVNIFEDEVDSLRRVLYSGKVAKSQHQQTGGVHEILEEAGRRRID